MTHNLFRRRGRRGQGEGEDGKVLLFEAEHDHPRALLVRAWPRLDGHCRAGGGKVQVKYGFAILN